MVAEGDVVVSHNVITGTHEGEFMGVAQTKKKFRATALDVCRFDESGKICEHWGVFDMFGAMMQLGVIPPPAPGRAP